MKKVAVIFEGDPSRRLGVFQAVVNRVKHLQALDDYKINVTLLTVYDGWLMRLLRGGKRHTDRPAVIHADGVTIAVKWIKRSWIDAALHRLLKMRPVMTLRRLNKMGWEMRGHDLVSAHDRIAGHVAVSARQKLQIPAFITWHGASIYTDPPRDAMVKRMTVELLRGATDNFFVSEGLLRKARQLTPDNFPADVLLNGANAQFHRYSDDRRTELRRAHNCLGSKVVAFIGRFEPVKNVLWLPQIYRLIKQKYDGDIIFWAIGDGVQLSETRQRMAGEGIHCKFFGLQPPEAMPDLMNCIDLLVLPSNLEGLPLVTIEALSCGANVVATNVIGTAEAIGRDNAIDLGNDFIERFTTRAAAMLRGEVEQRLPEAVSWTATAHKENEIYTAATTLPAGKGDKA